MQPERFNISKLTHTFFACVLLASYLSCGGERELGNGFVLNYSSGCVADIFHPSRSGREVRIRKIRFGGCTNREKSINQDSFLSGNVESYAVNDNWVTGYTSTKCLDLKVQTPACEGYFLLNTAALELLEGMSEDEWKQELQKINWHSPNLNKLNKSGQTIRSDQITQKE